MPFRKRGTMTRKRPYVRRRRRYPLRRNKLSLPSTYKFVRWDNDSQYAWFIQRTGISTWQNEPNPGGGGGLVYSLRAVRPRISLDGVVQNNEFVNLFRWFKINRVVTYIDFNYVDAPEYMAQKTDGLSQEQPNVQGVINEIADSATYAPPQSSTIYKPSRIFRVMTWMDKTSKLYQPTDINVLQDAKQIPSFRIYTARRRVTIVSRPTGFLTGQISGQTDDPASTTQNPMVQTRSYNWISTDQRNSNFFGPVFGVQPVCPLGFDIPNWWGVNFTVSQKYYLEFKGTR